MRSTSNTQVFTEEQRVLHGKDTGGVGAIEVSPDGKYIAVAEISSEPSQPPRVIIYTFATMKTHRILRKCSERGYVDCKFSPHNEEQFATLGVMRPEGA